MDPDPILSGPLFNEPFRIGPAEKGDEGRWSFGLVGTRKDRFRSVKLSESDLESLEITAGGFTYDGGRRAPPNRPPGLPLGVAWEFDPCFGLSISRVDPLRYQLDAVYDLLNSLARTVLPDRVAHQHRVTA